MAEFGGCLIIAGIILFVMSKIGEELNGIRIALEEFLKMEMKQLEKEERKEIDELEHSN